MKRNKNTSIENKNKMFTKNILHLGFFIFVISLFVINFCLAQSAYGPPIEKNSYKISRSKIERYITKGDIFKDSFRVTNLEDVQVRISVFPSEAVSDVIEMDNSGGIIEAKNYTDIYFNIIGKELRNYQGEIVISGGINEKIAVNISVVNKSMNPEFFLEVSPINKIFTPKEDLDFKIQLTKIQKENIKNVSFYYSIKDIETNKSYFLGIETKDIIGSLDIIKRFHMPENLSDGFYALEVLAEYKNKTLDSKAEFLLKTPFWSITILGFLPVWEIILAGGFFIASVISFVLIRRFIEKRKKYMMQLYTKTLPKKNERSILLGKVAETNIPAYFDIDALTTHAIVAGATGGGKSISAQVFIEEVLLKGISVIVFDPTAQWSGMLRKCEDKKMLSFYPKFGLKPQDAKAFPGNVRQIQNERQAIDIKKFMNPGQIQIFTLNKLTPPQIDTFVAGIVASIFNSDPKESSELKAILVFDEVHRLLPKFGGSGKGFLQIERACREFRKWGLGVMLVSQALSDFVGEIKANINTEVQMRTRDEADLNRIKTKYGEEFLQSLIKASVGVGMFVNPRYNKGKPYFINFRPILHNTRRLSDAVLDQYNKYGEIIDDLEYQIEQLEKEKVDTFDLKMELKLVKNKLMTGNFTVVDIYLEGLKPRIEKQWETLGKKPKKKEIELIAEDEVKKSIEQAQKGREEFEEKQGEKESEEKQMSNKKGDKTNRIVAPITFDNGAMASSLKELKEILPGLDDDVFSIHVNDDKNDISDWVEKEVDSELGKKIRTARDKNSILKIIEEFEKEPVKQEKIEDKTLTDKKKDMKNTQLNRKKESLKETKKIKKKKISKNSLIKKNIKK